MHTHTHTYSYILMRSTINQTTNSKGEAERKRKGDTIQHTSHILQPQQMRHCRFRKHKRENDVKIHQHFSIWCNNFAWKWYNLHLNDNNAIKNTQFNFTLNWNALQCQNVQRRERVCVCGFHLNFSQISRVFLLPLFTHCLPPSDTVLFSYCVFSSSNSYYFSSWIAIRMKTK